MTGDGRSLALMQSLPVQRVFGIATKQSTSDAFLVTHTAAFNGSAGCGIVAVAFDRASGEFAIRDSQTIPATHAGYVALDRTENFALIACTYGGAVAVVPIQSGARLLGAPIEVVAHPGKALVPLGHSQGSFTPPLPPGYCMPHAAIADPSNRFVFVPDVGLDTVFVYDFDSHAGKLGPRHDLDLQLPRHSGPRHLCFLPSGDCFFILNEISSSLVVVSWDAQTAVAEIVQTVSTLPRSFKGESAASEVIAHPTKGFIYASNRGHDSIGVFALIPGHRLDLVKIQPSGGSHPRSFCLTPSGDVMVVANRKSRNVAVFAVNATGDLDLINQAAEPYAPISVAIGGDAAG